MLVAAEITLRGDIPTFTVPANWPGYDVIAELPDGSLERISVKLRQAGQASDHIDFDPTKFDWMAIVVLHTDGDRQIFIAPSEIVARQATKRREWRRNPLSLKNVGKIPQWLLKYDSNFSLERRA